MFPSPFSRSLTLACAALSLLSACGGGGDAEPAQSTQLVANSAFPVSLDRKKLRPGDAVVPLPAPAPVVAPPPAADIFYPFGAHKTPYVAGIRPSLVSQAAQDALIRSRYDAWKSGVSARCGGYVVNFSASYATVSEGMGYGMLITVLMAGHDPQARALFDGLFKVVRANPAYSSDPALMNWRLNADCSSAGDGWNALDGDLDIAMALLMADKQWGSGGALNYKAEALRTIAAMKAKNMHPDGRTKGLPSGNNNRTSDYMIGHFKAFKRATNDAFWDLAVDKAFYLLTTMQASYTPQTGLIPDFIVNTGTNPAPSPGYTVEGNANEGFYYWNACRLPWRLATDYVTSGDTRSQVVLTKLMTFLDASASGQAGLLRSGYKLDGTVLKNYSSPSFSGPATAGALVDAKFQPFLDSLWSYASVYPARTYYDNELQFLSLVVASGNWWNP